MNDCSDIADHKKLAESLTPREREILGWLCTDLSAAKIGQIMDISARTAEKHVANVYKKIAVHRRNQAVYLAYRILAHQPSSSTVGALEVCEASEVREASGKQAA